MNYAERQVIPVLSAKPKQTKVSKVYSAWDGFEYRASEHLIFRLCITIPQ